MRHTLGFLLGLILTPGLLYGTAWGYVQAADSFDPVSREISDDTRLYGGVAVLAAVGLVIGIVMVARWASPLASVVPALALLAWTGYFFAEPDQALRLPSEVPPAGIVDAGLQVLLGSGIFAMLGCALLVPAGTPGRWRGRPADEEDEPLYTDTRTAEYF